MIIAGEQIFKIAASRFVNVSQDLGFDNSWYHAQPHPIIVYYMASFAREQDEPNRTMWLAMWFPGAMV